MKVRPGCHRSKAEPRGELKRPRAETRDDGDRRPESRVRRSIPDVSWIPSRVILLGRCVLDIVEWVLLEIGVIEEIESFSLQSQGKPLTQANVACHADVEIVHAWSGKGIKAL